MSDTFHPGELFVYTNENRWELGMVKRPNNTGDGYFCWYSRGDTAANTPTCHMHKLANAGFTHIEQLLDNAIPTAAQAIAATVGAGTCHYIPDDTGFTWWDEHDEEHYEGGSASYECGSASCDKCGYEMMVGDDGWFDGWDEITEWWEEDGSYHKGYVLTPRFKHCPNCGRRVVGA